jgi:hypothetical protein
MWCGEPFNGTKIALICGDRVFGLPSRCETRHSAYAPCRVRGQHCQYGECQGVAVCDVDTTGAYGTPNAQVWMMTFTDCL